MIEQFTLARCMVAPKRDRGIVFKFPRGAKARQYVQRSQMDMHVLLIKGQCAPARRGGGGEACTKAPAAVKAGAAG